MARIHSAHTIHRSEQNDRRSSTHKEGSQ